MSRDLSDIVRQLNGQVAVITAHMYWILNGKGSASGGPNGPYKNKWTKDINKALKEMAKDLERLSTRWSNSKTYWKYKRYIDKVIEWLNNPFETPPPTSPA